MPCLYVGRIMFYIYILSVHVIIYKNVVPACLQNTSGLTLCSVRILAKYASGLLPAVQCLSFSWLLARCEFHSVGRQLDANYIWLAAMQYKIPKLINSLHAAGKQPNEIYIRLAASRMQIL